MHCSLFYFVVTEQQAKQYVSRRRALASPTCKNYSRYEATLERAKSDLGRFNLFFGLFHAVKARTKLQFLAMDHSRHEAGRLIIRPLSSEVMESKMQSQLN